jgi:hypothetical protein
MSYLPEGDLELRQHNRWLKNCYILMQSIKSANDSIEEKAGEQNIGEYNNEFEVKKFDKV